MVMARMHLLLKGGRVCWKASSAIYIFGSVFVQKEIAMYIDISVCVCAMDTKALGMR